MIAAMVNTATGAVANVIVVDTLADPVPDGYQLVAVAAGQAVGVNWTWTAGLGLVASPPQSPPSSTVSVLSTLSTGS